MESILNVDNADTQTQTCLQPEGVLALPWEGTFVHHFDVTVINREYV